MDLQKFIMRQRLQTNAVLSLLTGRQTFFIDRMSQMVVRESSNFEWTSSDENLSDRNRNKKINDHAKRMTTSTNAVDKRLLNIFLMGKAHQEGVKFGFKNDAINLNNNKKFTLHTPNKVFAEKLNEDGTFEGLIEREKTVKIISSNSSEAVSVSNDRHLKWASSGTSSLVSEPS